MSITTATLVTTNDVEEATSDEGIIKVVAELVYGSSSAWIHPPGHFRTRRLFCEK